MLCGKYLYEMLKVRLICVEIVDRARSRRKKFLAHFFNRIDKSGLKRLQKKVLKMAKIRVILGILLLAMAHGGDLKFKLENAENGIHK